MCFEDVPYVRAKLVDKHKRKFMSLAPILYNTIKGFKCSFVALTSIYVHATVVAAIEYASDVPWRARVCPAGLVMWFPEVRETGNGTKSRVGGSALSECSCAVVELETFSNWKLAEDVFVDLRKYVRKHLSEA